MSVYDSGIKSFFSKVDKTILSRGRQYYKDGAVTRLEQSGDAFTAEVEGSGYAPYRVSVEFDDSGEVSEWSCGCPYDGGDVCKHVIAVLRAIKSMKPPKPDAPTSKSSKMELSAPDAPASNSTKSKSSASDAPVLKSSASDAPASKSAAPDAGDKSDSLAALLNKTPKERLAAILAELSENDIGLRAYLNSELGGSFDAELKLAKEQLALSIRSNTHSNCIDWRGCDNICYDMEAILDNADKRLANAQPRAAFELARLVLLRAMKLASTADSSSGMLGMAEGHAFDTFGEAIDMLALTDKAEKAKYLATLLKDSQNKVFDGWTDESYRLIEYAARLAGPKDRDKLVGALDSIGAKRNGGIMESYEKERYICAYFYVIDNIDGEAAGDIYLSQNINIPKLRRVAVERAIERGNFADAERLCHEMIDKKSIDVYGRPAEWYYLLYQCYERSGDHQKQLKTARDILLNGDTSYYSILKDFYTADGIWEAEYPALLRSMSARLSYEKYMALLASEGELELLMEQLMQHENELFNYGDRLAGSYPVEIGTLAEAYLLDEAEKANDRRQYKGLCSRIKKLSDWGLRDNARRVIEGLRQLYPRRPAMQEELDRVEARVVKAEAKKAKR